MRLEVTPHSVAAFLIVVAAAAAMALVVHQLTWWGRRLVAGAPVPGALVLLAVAGAAGFAVASRPCAGGWFASRPLGGCGIGLLVRLAGVAAVGVAGTALVGILRSRRGTSEPGDGSSR